MLAHDSPNKRVSSLGSESVRDCLGLRMYTMLALSKGAKAETFWHTHWQLDIFDRAVELVLRCPRDVEPLFRDSNWSLFILSLFWFGHKEYC